ncbi:hypothetical protein OC834_002800 [Tilletia horrida]|nr:hypothetical protein OC834_002800 [Tilletia horrida]
MSDRPDVSCSPERALAAALSASTTQDISFLLSTMQQHFGLPQEEWTDFCQSTSESLSKDRGAPARATAGRPQQDPPSRSEDPLWLRAWRLENEKKLQSATQKRRREQSPASEDIGDAGAKKLKPSGTMDDASKVASMSSDAASSNELVSRRTTFSGSAVAAAAPAAATGAEPGAAAAASAPPSASAFSPALNKAGTMTPSPVLNNAPDAAVATSAAATVANTASAAADDASRAASVIDDTACTTEHAARGVALSGTAAAAVATGTAGATPTAVAVPPAAAAAASASSAAPGNTAGVTSTPALTEAADYAAAAAAAAAAAVPGACPTDASTGAGITGTGTGASGCAPLPAAEDAVKPAAGVVATPGTTEEDESLSSEPDQSSSEDEERGKFARTALSPVVEEPFKKIPKSKSGKASGSGKGKGTRPVPAVQGKKRRGPRPIHNQNLPSEEWIKIYEYTLRLVAPGPADPLLIARRILLHLYGRPDSGTPVRARVEHVNGATLDRTNIPEMSSAAANAATSSSKLAEAVTWQRVLDWCLLSFLLRRASASLSNFKRAELVRGGSVSELKLKAADRWMILALALGDIAFLPLLLPLGDHATSLEKMASISPTIFGAFVEFLQTGEDRRDEASLWASDLVSASRRNAARFVAKYLLPISLGIVAKVLKASSKQGWGSTQVQVGNFKLKDRLPTVTGLDAAPNRPQFPINLRILLQGTCGLRVSTPPPAAFHRSYRKLLRPDRVHMTKREAIDFLCPRSMYGAIFECDETELDRLLPSYQVTLGLDDQSTAALDSLCRWVSRKKSFPPELEKALAKEVNITGTLGAIRSFRFLSMLDPLLLSRAEQSALGSHHRPSFPPAGTHTSSPGTVEASSKGLSTPSDALASIHDEFFGDHDTFLGDGTVGPPGLKQCASLNRAPQQEEGRSADGSEPFLKEMERRPDMLPTGSDGDADGEDEVEYTDIRGGDGGDRKKGLEEQGEDDNDQDDYEHPILRIKKEWALQLEDQQRCKHSGQRIFIDLAAQDSDASRFLSSSVEDDVRIPFQRAACDITDQEGRAYASLTFKLYHEARPEEIEAAYNWYWTDPNDRPKLEPYEEGRMLRLARAAMFFDRRRQDFQSVEAFQRWRRKRSYCGEDSGSGSARSHLRHSRDESSLLQEYHDMDEQQRRQHYEWFNRGPWNDLLPADETLARQRIACLHFLYLYVEHKLSTRPDAYRFFFKNFRIDANAYHRAVTQPTDAPPELNTPASASNAPAPALPCDAAANDGEVLVLQHPEGTKKTTAIPASPSFRKRRAKATSSSQANSRLADASDEMLSESELTP